MFETSVGDAPKIFVSYPIRNTPWGGGNQFLRAFHDYLQELGLLASNLDDADVTLINSHHFPRNLESLMRWRRADSSRRIMHRLDGPLGAVRGSARDHHLDQLVFSFNQCFADGSVFQSQWSLNRTLEAGYIPQSPVSIIGNVADPKFFFPPRRKSGSSKIRIVASSWSQNLKKGFPILASLDSKLDFGRFELTFIGNSPLKFENITCLPPMNSRKLGEELRKHDMYLTASQDDPCSNALLEGIASGLYPVALDSGGNPEILRNKGTLFEDATDLLEILNHFASNPNNLRGSSGNIEEEQNRLAEYLSLATCLTLGANKPNPITWCSHVFKYKVFLFEIKQLAEKIRSKLVHFLNLTT